MKGPLLKGYPVIIEIPLAWGDMDAFQHLNNVTYFRYMESSRIAYFDEVRYWEFMERTGIGPILASTKCRFRLPLTYPDVVSVGGSITDIGEDRFTMKHVIVSHRHSKVAAEGDGVLVTYDYPKNKKVPIPGELRQRILEIEKRAE